MRDPTLALQMAGNNHPHFDPRNRTCSEKLNQKIPPERFNIPHRWRVPHPLCSKGWGTDFLPRRPWYREWRSLAVFFSRRGLWGRRRCVLYDKKHGPRYGCFWTDHYPQHGSHAYLPRVVTLESKRRAGG